MGGKKGGLGRGINALFDENAADGNELVDIKVVDIEPNRDQPRKTFDNDALNELADSIKEHGLLQPIIVKPLPNGMYQIIAGERRWRASLIAGLDSVPAIIKNFSEREVAEVALIENLQREDLNPIEEAMGYQRLIDVYGMTQEQVATRVGKSRSTVANALRLLKLSDKEIADIKSGDISSGHARAILSAGDDLMLREKLVDMAKDGASVRELEHQVLAARAVKKKSENGLADSSFYSEVELALKEALHRRIKIQKLGEDHGMISIEFYGDDELSDIAQRLGGKKR